MSDQLEFKKIREFGEIINDIFTFIKQNFKALLKVFVYLCGIFIVGAIISGIFQQIDMRNVILQNNNPLFIVSRLASASYLLFFLFSLASYTSINVAILSFISVYIEKGNVTPTVEEVWAYFKQYFFKILGSSILISIFYMLCFVLLIIPGIYVTPAMMLFFPVMMFERANFGYSFNRAFALLKGQWWNTFGSIVIIYIITYACISLASLPATVITFVAAFTEGEKGLSTTAIIFSITLQYLCQVFMMIPVIGLSLCYFNLAERQDSGGLMDRISQLGNTKSAFNTPEEY